MKSCGKCEGCRIARSHPSRGAWIEILDMELDFYEFLVAPLAGCVD